MPRHTLALAGATFLTLAGAVGPDVSSSAGSLIILVRCRDGVLLAADSRLNDRLTGTYRDGVEKLYTDGPFAWFLTGNSSYIALEADTRRPLARVDLDGRMKKIGTRSDAGSAVELVRRMAADSANAVNELGRTYRVRLGEQLADAGLLGVVRQATDVAFARLTFGSDGRSIEVEVIPVRRVPRVAVVGNDRVYKAIEAGDPRFAQYRRDARFRSVYDAADDPSQQQAIDFAKWLISITSERDNDLGKSDDLVGGPPWFLFLTPTGSVWIPRR